MKDTSIKILLPAKNALDQLYSERGISKMQLVSRAMLWLADQDKTLQSIILGQADPVDTFEILELIRRRLEADIADLSPAAQIVDDAVAAVKVQKQKQHQSVQPKEA